MQKNQLLYNWEALVNILPYLKLSDLLSSATVSKEWNYHLSAYLKKVLLTPAQADLHSNPFTALKMIYQRHVLVWNQGQSQCCQFSEIPAEVSVGNLVTCITTLEGRRHIGYNKELCKYSRKHWQKEEGTTHLKLNKQMRFVRCVNDYLYIVRESDIIRYKPNLENVIFAEEDVLHFEATIDHFVTFNSGCLVLTGESSNNHHSYFFSHKDFKPIDIVLPFQLENPEKNIMPTFGYHGYLVNEGKVYELSFDNLPESLKQYAPLKGKPISKLMSGSKHFLAFERKQKLLKEWNNADVLKWAEQEKLTDYLKIFKAEKITGQKLLTISKDYMEDVLGVTSFKHQQKIKMLIQQLNANSEHHSNFIIYGWGKNDKGQLLANPSSNVTNPIKIKLPEDCELYSSSGEHSFVRNVKTGEMMTNIVLENKFKLVPIHSSKVWSVESNRSTIIFVASQASDRTPQAFSQTPVHVKKDKLRTAKNIVDKIQWSENLNQQDFRVGYMDSFAGCILEMSFAEYLASEVKEYHLLYFKEKDKIVWDKKARLDIL